MTSSIATDSLEVQQLEPVLEPGDDVPQQRDDVPLQDDATQKRIDGMFRNVVDSLGDMLNDITALEVNTMIVSEITGGKFIPESAYQNIYYCLTPQQTIPEVLRDRFRAKGIDRFLGNVRYANHVDRATAQQYWSLREKLQRDCHFIFNCADEKLPNPATDWGKMKTLLKNSRFLTSLRKLIELKATLGGEDVMCDIIYAQTIVQLDGDVINRFDKRLFKLPPEQKDLILHIHKEGVLSGEAQWRHLLSFVIDLVGSIGEKLGAVASGRQGLFQQNGR